MGQVATIGSNINNQFSKQPEVISHLSLTIRRDLPVRAYLVSQTNYILNTMILEFISFIEKIFKSLELFSYLKFLETTFAISLKYHFIE